jgi:hypothetical protein
MKDTTHRKTTQEKNDKNSKNVLPSGRRQMAAKPGTLHYLGGHDFRQSDIL